MKRDRGADEEVEVADVVEVDESKTNREQTKQVPRGARLIFVEHQK